MVIALVSYKRKRTRYAKLIPQAKLIDQLVKEKGYREKEVKQFLKDLNDIVIENLSCGNSVRLLPGLFLEVMLHQGQDVWSFKQKKLIHQEAYPILFARITGALKDKVYADESDFEDEEEFDKDGYDD